MRGTEKKTLSWNILLSVDVWNNMDEKPLNLEKR